MNDYGHDDFEIVQSCLKGWVRVDVYIMGMGYFMRIGHNGCDVQSLLRTNDEEIIVGIDET